MALIAKGEDAPQMAYVTWGTQDPSGRGARGKLCLDGGIAMVGL